MLAAAPPAAANGSGHLPNGSGLSSTRSGSLSSATSGALDSGGAEACLWPCLDLCFTSHYRCVVVCVYVLVLLVCWCVWMVLEGTAGLS